MTLQALADTLNENGFRKPMIEGQEFTGRHELSAGDTGNVRDQQFHFIDPVVFEPGCGLDTHKPSGIAAVRLVYRIQ